MQTILHTIPNYLTTLIEALRTRLRDPNFLARHRVRPQDFSRQRQLTFPVLMLFVLQQTVKSIQRHLHQFLDDLAQGQIFEPVSSGAVTHARAKLKDSAFIELNRDCVLPIIYGPEHPIQRWRGHRLLGIDSSLVRLPDSQELGQTFGWKEASNQHGATGTRYPEARLSVVYDLLNRVGLDTRLEPSTVGEVALAIQQQQLEQVRPGDVEINDRGFTGYLYLASVVQRGRHFIGRCSTGSFLTAQELFRLNRANQSKVVWLFAPPDQKAQCQRLGLPLKLRVRFVSLRLPDGKLELLANLESVLTEPTQAALRQQGTAQTQPRQVNRSNSYHALKDQVLDLLYRDIPISLVINKLMKLFEGSPVVVRPHRNVRRRRKASFHRSYHFQRRVKKTVF